MQHFDHQMIKFLDVNNVEYIGEPKLDGLAVELVYENGIFQYGSIFYQRYLRAQEELEPRTRCKIKLKVHIF